ncbi:MAG: hypothetical protein IIX61_01320, partial [Loktanella sp.]|nr:hypothetical protein [Loktanella sp.]
GITPDGLPGGVTLIGPAFSDDGLAPFAAKMHAAAACGMGRDTQAAIPTLDTTAIPKGMIPLAVVGAHLTGMPLNHQLIDAGGRLLRETTTDAAYRLYALDGTVPPKPGLIRAQDGAAIKVEIWALPEAAFGRFVTAIPAPLGIGKLTLADGTEVSGFLCESHAITDATDITDHGGWRAYVASLSHRQSLNIPAGGRKVLTPRRAIMRQSQVIALWQKLPPPMPVKRAESVNMRQTVWRVGEPEHGLAPSGGCDIGVKIGTTQINTRRIADDPCK